MLWIWVVLSILAIAFARENGSLFGSLSAWLDTGLQSLFSAAPSPRRRIQLGEILETNTSRISTSRLCDHSVKQYSGYFDISSQKHLFFRFFESRSSPSRDPVILWLQGGPGDSSAVGLLAELGPCSIAFEGNATRPNPYSWTNHANVIFLDQPVGVGFSYNDSAAAECKSNAAAAEDVYAFLQLFFARFPEYADLPLHIAGESYGGMWAPNVASAVWRGNQQAQRRIRLESVILANGITHPEIQIPSIVDYACEGPYADAVFPDGGDGDECRSLRSSVATCRWLIRACNWFPTELICGRAAGYCRSKLFAPTMKSHLNWYDLRKTCDASAIARPEHCYPETAWVERYMNDPGVKHALGVAPERMYQNFNMEMNRDFNARGEGVRSAARLLTELVEDGVRVLVYAGTADMMANYMGNERWTADLAAKTRFRDEFTASEPTDWVLSTSSTGPVAGRVRSAGPGAGNIAFVAVYEAGHMSAHDQPAAISELITRWIEHVRLV
ncbi:Carboxypeptidase [Mycena kentingensis (nom. inval.)]|nr:Carboxypeptidase [Mycena kentingensis (nom. inval.)]